MTLLMVGLQLVAFLINYNHSMYSYLSVVYFTFFSSPAASSDVRGGDVFPLEITFPVSSCDVREEDASPLEWLTSQ